MQTTRTRQYVLEKALAAGAKNAALFEPSDIVFDPRARLKCMFGCKSWGYGNLCPSRPGSLLPWDYQRIFQHYSWGVLIHTENKNLSQSISLNLEKELFFSGYYFAFSLSDCNLCETCGGFNGEPCRNPEDARPSLQNVGVDVFKTAKNFTMPLSVLESENQTYNWYAAVFVE